MPVSTPTAKKQQSISSFFTSRPVPERNRSSQSAAASSPLTQRPANPKAASSTRDGGAQSLDDDEVDTESRLSDSSKRALEVDPSQANANHNGNGPATKRRRSNRRTVDDDEGSDASFQDSSLEQQLPTVPSLPEAINGKGASPKLPPRTSKYLFDGSSQSQREPGPALDDDSDPEVKARKAKLHQQFVRKLGRPDSIAEIKRRNRFITDDVPDAEEGEETDEEDDSAQQAKAPAKGKKGVPAKRSSSKLTPMEKQVLEIKRKHPDTLLVVEVGYKFRFFGEDARTAAKVLSIVCIPGKFRFDEHPSEAHIDRFASASVPVHRLHVHVKRLVAAGHKVGVVRQLETAALKAAGDNRNAPFERKLTNVYTKGTYIDDVEGLDEPTKGPSGGAPATGYLLCITETNAKGWGTDEKVQVGIVAVQPATGDVIYDDFEDGFMRSEIETRLLHIAPCEFLIVGTMSKATEKLMQHLSGSSTNVFGDKIRVERVEKPSTMAAQSYSHVSNFYAGKLDPSRDGDDENAANLLDKVLKLPEHVTICLSAMINHLKEYGLEHVFDLTKYFQSFSARSHMLLNGNTLTSLEIYHNQTDYSEKGSLFWTLDRTKTRFGQRLMRKWVGRPLLDKARLEERVAAVEELLSGEKTAMVEKLRGLLSKVKSDLEKSLIRIYYGKCTRPELLTVLQTMQRIANEFAFVQPGEALFSSATLNTAVAALPTISEDVVKYLDMINPEAARADDRYAFFRDSHESDDITEQKLGIASVEHELDQHRPEAAEKIRKKKVEYVTVANIEYLIEVENSQIKNVPASWAKISGTKKVSRFHTPKVIALIRERDRHKESLAAACDAAFAALLASIASNYQALRDCVQALATLDCLLSLAAVASQPGYTKPTYTSSPTLLVRGGRHPMVEQLLLDTYVPNDTALSAAATRALLITGPNMGGKSSYVRHVALIAIMGQIGSYVPAEAAELGMLDAVFTRMGANDNILASQSTFMVELSETADILKLATPRSLVILDELGRGTSTHDGLAIAHAVLDYVVRESRCLTLFITHHQSLAALAAAFDGQQLRNVHMRFTEGGADGQDITFLYEVGEGVAHRSYGLNVARLAHLPASVLAVAAAKSAQLEQEVARRKLTALARALLLPPKHRGADEKTSGQGGGAGDEVESLVAAIEQL